MRRAGAAVESCRGAPPSKERGGGRNGALRREGVVVHPPRFDSPPPCLAPDLARAQPAVRVRSARCSADPQRSGQKPAPLLPSSHIVDCLPSSATRVAAMPFRCCKCGTNDVEEPQAPTAGAGAARARTERDAASSAPVSSSRDSSRDSSPVARGRNHQDGPVESNRDTDTGERRGEAGPVGATSSTRSRADSPPSLRPDGGQNRPSGGDSGALGESATGSDAERGARAADTASESSRHGRAQSARSADGRGRNSSAGAVPSGVATGAAKQERKPDARERTDDAAAHSDDPRQRSLRSPATGGEGGAAARKPVGTEGVGASATRDVEEGRSEGSEAGREQRRT